MIPRTSAQKLWFFVRFAVIVSGLAGQASAQRAVPSSQSAGGKSLQQRVHAAFNPGITDASGHVLQAIPDHRTGPDAGPGMSEQGKADKVLAEQHKGPTLHKPMPRLVGDSGSNMARSVRTNRWKLAEGREEAAQESDFVGVNDTNSEPPDVAMAAGPNQILAAANSVVNTWDKTGTLLSSQTFSSFFSALPEYASWFIYDPVVTYDDYINRFWLIATALNDSSKGSVVLIALSSSQDPSPGGWDMWAVDFTVDGSSGTNNWCDYPHVGYDAQAIYISCNQFEFPSSSGSFQYAKVRLMNKAQFLNDTCCSWWDHWNLKEGTFNLHTSMTVQPAVMRNASPSDGEFLIDAQGGGGSGSTLQVWHFPNPIGNPGQLDDGNVSVTGYAPAPAAQQPFGTTGLDTGDARLLFANWQAGHLSTGQTTSCNNRSCAAFYELDVSGFSNISVVNDWALQGDTDYCYPSVDQNNSSNKTMVYTRTSASEFAGADFATIPNSKACTSCFGGENSLEPGTSTYSRICCNNRNRWGDYFSVSADPDGLGIWISGEFVDATNVWATEIAATYNSYKPVDQPSTSAVNFGNQAVGTSTQQLVFFFNTGNADLEIDNVKAAGTDFSETDTCTANPVEPAFNCVVTVVFKPSAAATRTGTLYVFDNAAGSPREVSLSGTGVAATATVTPATLTFPATASHLTSVARTVTITNTGIVPLTVSGITTTARFTHTNNCVGTVGAGSTCAVSVKFTPLKAGMQTGTLTIQDDASTSPQTVALSGTGTDFTIAISPATITVSRGHATKATITVTPIDNFAGIVQLTCAVPAGHSLGCAVSPTSLTIKGSAQTSVLEIGAGTQIIGGTYAVEVKGAEGALNHTATVKLTVN